MTTTAAAAGTRRHIGTYPAEPAQVGQARAAGVSALCTLSQDAWPRLI
jgi:hypothetical protein